MHPCRRAQNRLVGQQRPARCEPGSRDGAPRYAPCRAGRRGGCAFFPERRRREACSLAALDMCAPAETRLYRLVLERLRNCRMRLRATDFAAARTMGHRAAPSRCWPFRQPRPGSGRNRSTPRDDRAHAGQRTSSRSSRPGRGSQASTVGPRRPSRTEAVPTAAASRTEGRTDRRRGRPGPSPGENRWRSQPRLQGSHAPPTDRRLPGRGFACPSEQGPGADAARCDGRDTGWRRPRCS